MKVLVTGQKSYAGTQFAKRIIELNKDWEIDYISVRDNVWKHEDFSSYDAIYHVAGIVHQKEISEKTYFTINRDLTFELASKAKRERVKSFVFLSTMGVYGLDGRIGEEVIITKETIPTPGSPYGKSKLAAEIEIESLNSEEFYVSILRIPMIYGHNCPGNYSKLSNLINRIPIFPNIKNKRSMIYIDHLSDVVIHIIKNNIKGTLLVKNPEEVSTLNMVVEMSKYKKRKLYKSFFGGGLIKLIGNNFSVTRKLFGNLSYKDKDCFTNNFDFYPITFEKTIEISEVGNKSRNEVAKGHE